MGLRSTLACMLVVFATGCGGDDTADDTAARDAPPPAIDSPPARACDGRAYDPCQDTVGWTDCMSGMECRFFMGDGITECTPACDTATPCPNDENGNPVACNTMGRCKANPPSSCTL